MEISSLMETIRIKCPVCGAVLEVLDDPANAEKNVKCPNCQQRNKFNDFKRVLPAPVPVSPEQDETHIDVMREESAGYLLDRMTGRSYPLHKGKQLVGRNTHKSAPKADIPVETADLGMSREHLFIDVMSGRDGRYHIYVSNAKNQNPTQINGAPLAHSSAIII